MIFVLILVTKNSGVFPEKNILKSVMVKHDIQQQISSIKFKNR